MPHFRFVLSMFVLLAGSLCTAQLTTGLPPFSTIQGSLYDDVKVNDGAVLLRLPVRNKAGLIPFSYSLVLNDAVGINSILNANIQTNWTPQTSVGFSPAFGAGFTTLQTLKCSKGTTVKFTNYQITDGYGTAHKVLGMQVDTLQCYTQIRSGGTNDGSGYGVTVDSNGLNPIIQDRAGNTLKSGSFADPNSNQLSFTVVCSPCIVNQPSTTTITYKDTTGLIPITETQTWNSSNVLTQDSHAWTDAAGKTQSYTINYSPYLHVTNFGCYIPGDDAPSTWYMPSSITTSEGNYAISYETTLDYTGYYTGRIAKIVFPSGASVAYKYTGGSNNSGLTCEAQTPNGIYYSVMVPVLTTTLTDTNGTQHTGKYDTTQATNETVVTDPSGNDTVYLFYTPSGPVSVNKGFYETQRQIYQGSHTSGTLLKTVLTCYNGNPTNCANPSTVAPPILQKDVYTTLSGMTHSSLSETKYDYSGDLVVDKEYDFTGTLVSDRVINYGNYSNGNCTNPIGSIYNRVCTDVTQIGSALVAQTNNSYDTKGNLISSSHLAGGSHYLTSSATYNSNGTVNVATDVNGAQTIYGLTSNYACNGNFPVGVSEPLGLSKSMTWDCNGGVIGTLIDENSQKQTYTYVNPTSGLADPFYRPTSSSDPIGNVTNYTYSPTTFESALNFNGAVSTTDSLVTTDGLGHQLLGQTRQGRGSSSFDTTQSGYDLNFRSASVSIPCVAPAGSGCSTPVTTTTYDGLSRPLQVTEGGPATSTITMLRMESTRTTCLLPSGPIPRERT